jgi:hypothetical protein
MKRPGTKVQSWSDLFLGDQTSSGLTLTSNSLENMSDLRLALLTFNADFVMLTPDLRADLLRRGGKRTARSVELLDCLAPDSHSVGF